MIPQPRRLGFRFAALLTSISLAAGCAPVGPGIYQQQANNAAYACQLGNPQACQDYQALAPAARTAKICENGGNCKIAFIHFRPARTPPPLMQMCFSHDFPILIKRH